MGRLGRLPDLRWPAGRERFAFVVQEITKRKRAEEILARDALLLANVRDSIIVTDMDGIVTYWNEVPPGSSAGGRRRSSGDRRRRRCPSRHARRARGESGHPRREGVPGRVGALP